MRVSTTVLIATVSLYSRQHHISATDDARNLVSFNEERGANVSSPSTLDVDTSAASGSQGSPSLSSSDVTQKDKDALVREKNRILDEALGGSAGSDNKSKMDALLRLDEDELDKMLASFSTLDQANKGNTSSAPVTTKVDSKAVDLPKDGSGKDSSNVSAWLAKYGDTDATDSSGSSLSNTLQSAKTPSLLTSGSDSDGSSMPSKVKAGDTSNVSAWLAKYGGSDLSDSDSSSSKSTGEGKSNVSSWLAKYGGSDASDSGKSDSSKTSPDPKPPGSDTSYMDGLLALSDKDLKPPSIDNVLKGTGASAPAPPPADGSDKEEPPASTPAPTPAPTQKKCDSGWFAHTKSWFKKKIFGSDECALDRRLRTFEE
ncbi:uncharacterized protein PHALS_01910 [Plasmopara halstedii]|uniref:RxLR-like protein n=1 Tax=Plasmopara halstedii TaxID=4781 RepID=A0A0P1AWV1_PLAHL|nr:uncharacterized protein PHALS_01910 [Plasmopara halstedii]CEG45626.1 hypothetical protein PHALS_01910 [Plasmopara halstedii]|eukprot:XP_024581995.1 hypothetical protein PHALS_01910 [Plasmopara halstedii]